MTAEFFPNAGNIEEIKKVHENFGMVVMDPSSIARSIVWLLSEDSLDVNGINMAVGEGAP
jgi:chanoclavine-I dehydrogenase